MDVWRKRKLIKMPVNRVWDLVEDRLVQDMDVRNVVFISHRWLDGKVAKEVEYEKLKRKKDEESITGLSKQSTKLGDIRRSLIQYNVRYLWMDTICSDKSNSTELDEAIRSMYKWYGNCRAVVLAPGTDLKEWRRRGWCLQEGAAASILCGIHSGKLVTVRTLAAEQNVHLCELDLSVYYRPGNAATIISMMDRRNTKRIEDSSYALTGIFSIHLAMAYGEGKRARERLLRELATQKGDLSSLSFISSPMKVAT